MYFHDCIIVNWLLKLIKKFNFDRHEMKSVHFRANPFQMVNLLCFHESDNLYLQNGSQYYSTSSIFPFKLNICIFNKKISIQNFSLDIT